MRYLVGFFAVLGLLGVLLLSGALVGISWIGDTLTEPPELADSLILHATPTGSPPEVTDPSSITGLVPGAGAMSLFDMVTALDAASRDARVKGLVMDLSGADLGLAEAQELRAAVLRFRSTGRFTRAFADSFDGGRSSAIYYLATGFEQINLQPSGLLDVRGVSLTTPLLGRLLDEHGVRADFLTRHEFKGAAVPMTESTLPGPVRKNFQRAVDSLFEQILAGIAAARNLGTSAVRTMIDQAPLLAREARDNHLVDGLLYWDQVIDEVEGRAPEAEIVGLDHYAVALEPVEAEKTIAVIAADGEIVRGDGRPYSAHEGAAANRLVEAIREAREDEAVRAVVLRINSPGGSYTASDTILRELKRTREDGKPIVVSMSSLAASGGYFIALAANHIVAHPASITGSIGTLSGKISINEFLNRHGVDSADVSAGANATMYSPLRPFTADQRGRLGHLLDAVYADFTAQVGRSRRLSPEELDAVARGRIWTGEDALRLGLVDVLGGFEEAVSLARQSAGIENDDAVDLTVFPRDRGPVEKLLDLVSRQDLIAIGGVLGDLTHLLGYARQAVRILPAPTMADGVMLRALPIQVR